MERLKQGLRHHQSIYSINVRCFMQSLSASWYMLLGLYQKAQENFQELLLFKISFLIIIFSPALRSKTE